MAATNLVLICKHGFRLLPVFMPLVNCHPVPYRRVPASGGGGNNRMSIDSGAIESRISFRFHRNIFAQLDKETHFKRPQMNEWSHHQHSGSQVFRLRSAPIARGCKSSWRPNETNENRLLCPLLFCDCNCAFTHVLTLKQLQFSVVLEVSHIQRNETMEDALCRIVTLPEQMSLPHADYRKYSGSSFSFRFLPLLLSFFFVRVSFICEMNDLGEHTLRSSLLLSLIFLKPMKFLKWCKRGKILQVMIKICEMVTFFFKNPNWGRDCSSA